MLGRAGLSRERHVEERTKRLPEVLNGELMRARASWRSTLRRFRWSPETKMGSASMSLKENGISLVWYKEIPGTFGTLRGLDLNQRPLGYELKNQLARLCFSMI